MEIIWSVIWGLMTPVIMFLTIEYYLPLLSRRVQESNSEAPALSARDEPETSVRSFESSCEQRFEPKSILLSRRWRQVILLSCAALFAARCGYAACAHATSWMGFAKMTVTFAVLAGVFITDLELFLIPNLYSLIIIGAKLLSLVLEWIFLPEAVLGNLIDGVFALVSCLALLLVMSRITKGGLGMGDVKLFSSIGFLCGMRTACYSLVLSFVFCALCSTVFLITRKKQMKDALPLGPFILIGFGISILMTLI